MDLSLILSSYKEALVNLYVALMRWLWLVTFLSHSGISAGLIFLRFADVSGMSGDRLRKGILDLDLVAAGFFAAVLAFAAALGLAVGLAFGFAGAVVFLRDGIMD